MGLMDRFKNSQAIQDLSMPGRINRLANEGVETPGVIQRATPTGRTDLGGGQEYEFEVEVQPAGGTPYQATFTQYMHPGSMGAWVALGASVNLRVDPAYPDRMMVFGARY